MEKIVNLQANGKALDLTPPEMDNWISKEGAVPVLIISPEATLNQRAALAFIMASETLSIMQISVAAHGRDAGNDSAILYVAVERLHQLERMLSDIIGRIGRLEGGAA